jgi:hypothetical protein
MKKKQFLALALSAVMAGGMLRKQQRKQQLFKE